MSREVLLLYTSTPVESRITIVQGVCSCLSLFSKQPRFPLLNMRSIKYINLCVGRCPSSNSYNVPDLPNSGATASNAVRHPYAPYSVA